jgi:hypothetical protein
MRLTSLIYVATVALLATAGFVVQSPWPILFAALLALPASTVALPAYYMAYGFLALIPGANPSEVTSSSSFAPDGSEVKTITGAPAAWFTVTTPLLGILALTGAAILNVVLLRAVADWRRRTKTVQPRDQT